MTSFGTDEANGTMARGFVLWLWISGVASIVLGIVALVFPFAATIAAELLFGAVLATVGAIQVFSAFLARRSGNRVWSFLFGIAALVAGGLLLLYPLQGALTLTIILASFLLAGGAFEMISAWYLRPANLHFVGLPPVRGWGWLAASGVLSIILGIILLFGLPVTSVWALGLFLGIDLIFLGFCEISFARALQREG
jgi:uncharacterized membrane protein HdeD (DUF308 family)